MANIHSLNRISLRWAKGLPPVRRTLRFALLRWQVGRGRLLALPLATLKILAVCGLCLLCLTSFPTFVRAESRAIALSTEIIQPLSDSADIAADKVDQFAQAYLQVLQVLSDRESELPTAETSAEALKVQQSIEAEAVEKIKGSGLTLAEYMQILGLASQDTAFRDKVLGRMDESLEE